MALKLAAVASLLIILREMHEKIFIKFARYVGFDKSVTFWGSCVYNLTHWYRIFSWTRLYSLHFGKHERIFRKFSGLVGYGTKKQFAKLIHAWPHCFTLLNLVTAGISALGFIPVAFVFAFFLVAVTHTFYAKKMSMVVFLLLSTFTFVLVLSFSNTSIPIYVILTVIHWAVYICIYQLSSWMCLKIVNLFFSV